MLCVLVTVLSPASVKKQKCLRVSNFVFSLALFMRHHGSAGVKLSKQVECPFQDNVPPRQISTACRNFELLGDSRQLNEQSSSSSWHSHSHHFDYSATVTHCLCISVGYLFLELRWVWACLLYTSPSPRDQLSSRMPSSA